MEMVKIAFIPPTTGTNVSCKLVNYNAETRNTRVTRTNTGRYTVTFLTKTDIDETKKMYPVIHVTCQNPTGTGTVVNVLNPTATYQPKNQDGYNYLVSFQIETINLLQALPVFTLLNILALLSGLFLVAFVDRPLVMISCEWLCCTNKYPE